MYIEPTDKALVDIYKCRGCQGIYHRQQGRYQISCCVAHGEGSCCHYGETQVTVDQVKEIRKILFGESASNEEITVINGVGSAIVNVDGSISNLTTTNDGSFNIGGTTKCPTQ